MEESKHSGFVGVSPGVAEPELSFRDDPANNTIRLNSHAEVIGILDVRIASLEQDRERFLKALRGAIEMLLENPMASAMMPKEMKRDLRTYLEQNGNGNAKTETR